MLRPSSDQYSPNNIRESSESISGRVKTLVAVAETGECLSITCYNSRSRALRECELPCIVLNIPPACSTGTPLQFGALLGMFEPDRLRNVSGDEYQTAFDIFESFQ